MVGFKRRARVEGWALDTSESEDTAKSTLQRLGDNNKLWIITLLVVLILAAVVMNQAKDTSVGDNKDLYTPPVAPRTGAYTDEKHRAFAQQFIQAKARGTVVDARFTDDRSFRVIVAGDVSADDIWYDSYMAAQYILEEFKYRVAVKTYQRSASAGRDVLRATTDWDMQKHGFVVKLVQEEK